MLEMMILGRSKIILDPELSFDHNGNLRYHPDFHPNHGKPFSLDDMIYLCKYYGHDDMKSLSLAVGKTANTVMGKIIRMKKLGQYERYRNMSDEEWQRIAEGGENEDEGTDRRRHQASQAHCEQVHAASKLFSN